MDLRHPGQVPFTVSSNVKRSMCLVSLHDKEKHAICLNAVQSLPSLYFQAQFRKLPESQTRTENKINLIMATEKSTLSF